MAMNKKTEEKIEREIKQVGIDLMIGLIIISLILGFALGVLVN